MQSFIGCNFRDMKQSRKNVVSSLASMSSTVKINGETVTINPLTIFQRTLIAKKSDKDVADLLVYELTPFPLALFSEGGMRKGKKSSLYDALPVEDNATLDLTATTNVVDGGFLLHRVKWKTCSKTSSICDQYIAYVLKYYGKKCTVVFDGYGDAESTKRAEQKRRGLKKSSVDINFSESTTITVQQEDFLANERNKTRLLHLLTQKMTATGIDTIFTTGDADATIVRCGLDKAAVHETVAIVGEDVDLIVLLIGLATPSSNNIYFVKPGRGKVETKVFSVWRLEQLPYADTILLLHSFSGCDTTSAIYGRSKMGMVKLFTANPRLTRDITTVFSNPKSSPDEVEQAGEKMFLVIFQAPLEQNLNGHRYAAFLKASSKPKFDMAALPPTRGATKQHSLRVYLQIQQWLTNPLPPTQWGWTRGADGDLIPITTNDPVAPEAVLNTIFCRCTTGCGGRCGCRKAGIACSGACGTCLGTCANGPSVDDGADNEDDFDLHD